MKRADGRSINVKLQLLSKEDQKFVAENRRSALGIRCVDLSDARAVLAEKKKQTTLPADDGILVLDVVAGSPAEQAGIEQWDIITTLDGKPTTAIGIGYLVPGTKCHVSVLRLAKIDRKSRTPPKEQPSRDWKVRSGTAKGRSGSSKGRFLTVSGQLVRIDDGFAVLKVGTSERRVATDKLSDDDQRYLANVLAWEKLSCEILVSSFAEMQELAANQCPLKITAARLERDAIGTPILVLSVKNGGIQPIAAFKLSIEVFNKFDEPIRKFGFGENETVGIDQDELGTGDGGRSRMQMGIARARHGGKIQGLCLEAKTQGWCGLVTQARP